MSEEKTLTLPERASVALGAPKYEQEIRELVAKTVTITEVKNKDGREQCHGAMMTLKNARVAIEKAAKAAREDATAFSKAVIAEERRLVALTEPEETRLQGLRDAWDAEIEREKAAKAAAEKARVDGIRKRIAEVQAIPAMLVGKQSQTIAAAIESLEAVEITLEAFAEFAGESQMVKIAAVQKLGEMLSAQVAHEDEQKRILAEREELERQRAAEAARLAAERAQLERERAEAAERERKAAAERAEAERVARVAREAEEARLRAEREAHEAELRKQREAEEAKLRAAREEAQRQLDEQRREIERQQAEIAAAKAEQERIERERLAAIEAEERRKREEAEAVARAEAARIEAERRAAEQEQIRREREQFAINGPGDVEMVKVLANHYGVVIGDVMQWMKKFDYDAADEHFAAANVAANQMEKAA
ncbi:hypothetical protein AB4Y43_01085 [Paraburkholderia sp. BR10872]|uniref:hypothetical protein n=1 Tax=Paraburkholderia sp. BR10872 TaxID=3236989 RepID=UPI0034D1C126